MPRETSVTIKARRIGGFAYRYLMAEPRTGRVLSSFQHGLNVGFCEGSEARTVTLHTPALPLHPWGVEVAGLVSAQQNTPVLIDSTSLRLGDLSLHLDNATVCDLTIKHYTQDEARRARSRWPALAEALPSLHAARRRDPLAHRIRALLADWKRTDDVRSLADLLGLGIGSTPAGDDVLVGLLAGLRALSTVSTSAQTAVTSIREALGGEELLARTTRASAQSIVAALDGAVVEPLRVMVQHLGGNGLRRATLDLDLQGVLRLGSTSGVSMLRGLDSALECPLPERRSRVDQRSPDPLV